MTEAEWLGAQTPWPLLGHLISRAPVRKHHLFAVACCRRIWHLILSKRARWWVEAAEHLADGRPIWCDVDDLAHDEWAPIRPVGPVVYHPIGHPVPWDPEGERRNNWEAFQHIDGYRQDRKSESAYHAILAAQATVQHQDESETPGDPEAWAYDLRLVHAHQLAARAVAHWRRPSDDAEPDPQVIADELTAQMPLLWDVFEDSLRDVEFDPRWRTADVVGLARAIYDDRVFERLPLLADALMDAGCADEHVLSHCRSDGPHVRGCWVVDLVLDMNRPPNPVQEPPKTVRKRPDVDEYELWYEPPRRRRGRQAGHGPRRTDA
jgi:hypothetical protein